MKSAKVRSILFALTGTLVLAASQYGGLAVAATTAKKSSSAIDNNANSLRISPLRTDLTISPGATGVVPIMVTNLTSQPMTLQAIENDFVAGPNENGTPALILNPSSYAPEHSLKRFMVPLSDVSIDAGATQTVSVKIVVPKTAQAGGYFGALRFAPAGSGSEPVVLNGSVASLILMTVPGPTYEQLTLTNFAVQQNGGSASSFRTPNNLSLLLRFENKGNLQEAPFGQIYVQKGKKVVDSYNFNSGTPKQEILPDSYRRWYVPLKGMGKFGKYTVGATLSYGTKGESIDITKTIWIIPTAYILAVVIIVVLLVVIIGGSWFFLKSYKRKILQSSRRRY